MVFCGQCGLQLARGSTRCPRCGATIEEPQTGAAPEELHNDDPTMASPSIRAAMTQHQRPNGHSSQPLMLGSGINQMDQAGQATYQNTPYDATSMVDPAAYTQVQSQQLGPGNTYNGYPSPSITTGTYPQPQGPYNEYGTMGGGSYATGMPYQHQQELAAINARGRTTGLILVLFGLILIFGAVILFAVQQHMI